MASGKALTRLATTCLVFISILTGLLVSEGMLQLLGYQSFILIRSMRPNAEYIEHFADGSFDIRPNAPPDQVDFIEHQYQAWSNEQGCFDTPFSVMDRNPYVYLAGDSFSWGYVPQEYKWGTVLEGEIGVRVLKCGVLGYGTKAELMKAHKILDPIRPPSVIIVQYFWNDALDDSGVTPNSCEPLICWMYHGWLFENSIVYNLVLRLAQTSLIWTYPEPTSEMYATNIKNIAAFKRFAEEKGSRLMFVLVPTKLMVTVGRTLSQDPITQYLESEDIPFIDLRTPLEDFYDKSGKLLYWKSDFHWNLLGNQVAGLLVARAMIEQGIVPIGDSEAAIRHISEELDSLASTTDSIR